MTKPEVITELKALGVLKVDGQTPSRWRNVSKDKLEAVLSACLSGAECPIEYEVEVKDEPIIDPETETTDSETVDEVIEADDLEESGDDVVETVESEEEPDETVVEEELVDEISDVVPEVENSVSFKHISPSGTYRNSHFWEIHFSTFRDIEDNGNADQLLDHGLHDFYHTVKAYKTSVWLRCNSTGVFKRVYT